MKPSILALHSIEDQRSNLSWRCRSMTKASKKLLHSIVLCGP